MQIMQCVIYMPYKGVFILGVQRTPKMKIEFVRQYVRVVPQEKEEVARI